MKRYVYMFFMIIVSFLMQTTIFPHIQLLNVIPNLLIVLTATSGFMRGRKFGLFTGFICGSLMDLMYNDVIGICIFIFVVIGYFNGIANKLYFEDDLSIPLTAIAVSDLLYGILFYICMFLMRGRLNFFSYFFTIMIPETIYTIFFGIFIYKFIHWLDGKLYPPEEVSFEQENKLYS